MITCINFRSEQRKAKKRLSPEVPIKKILRKLRIILAAKKRHHTLKIMPQKPREGGMELQHDKALTEKNQDCYVYPTVCTSAINEMKSMVNLSLQ